MKGRAKGQSTITVSRNEILYALNQKDKFWLAIALVDPLEEDHYDGPYYVRNPFGEKPPDDFGITSINYDLSELLSTRAVSPEQTF